MAGAFLGGGTDSKKWGYLERSGRKSREAYQTLAAVLLRTTLNLHNIGWEAEEFS